MSRTTSVKYPIGKVKGIAVNTSIPSSSSNYYSYESRTINYIVMHYTGNPSDKAVSNARYFNTGARNASAHYFVDDDRIYQSVPVNFAAWAVGGTSNYKHPYCRNSNSVSIEMCCSGNYSISAKTEENAVQLCAALCRYLNIEDVDECVLRHWDVWSKDCPSGWTGSDNARWTKFKARVKATLRGESEEIDMEELNKLRAELAAYKVKTDCIINKMGEEIDALKPDVYDYFDKNMPSWAIPTIQKLMGRGIIKGDSEGKFGLTYDFIRLLVILDRVGVLG